MSLALATVLMLAACAADGSASEGAIPDNYPTIAPAMVDGRYDVIEINGPTGPVALDDAVPPTVEVDVVTGELRIEPLCNRYLGSFTLDPDGTASFTVTGGTSETCPDPAIEQAVLDAFGAADRWTETDDGLELSGSASTMIRLRRS
jgi:heat shock protein HslJ